MSRLRRNPRQNPRRNTYGDRISDNVERNRKKVADELMGRRDPRLPSGIQTLLADLDLTDINTDTIPPGIQTLLATLDEDDGTADEVAERRRRMVSALGKMAVTAAATAAGMALAEEDEEDDSAITEGTITYPNGDVYVGEIKNGKPHGKGTMYYHGDSPYKDWGDEGEAPESPDVELEDVESELLEEDGRLEEYGRLEEEEDKDANITKLDLKEWLDKTNYPKWLAENKKPIGFSKKDYKDWVTDSEVDSLANVGSFLEVIANRGFGLKEQVLQLTTVKRDTVYLNKPESQHVAKTMKRLLNRTKPGYSNFLMQMNNIKPLRNNTINLEESGPLSITTISDKEGKLRSMKISNENLTCALFNVSGNDYLNNTNGLLSNSTELGPLNGFYGICGEGSMDDYQLASNQVFTSVVDKMDVNTVFPSVGRRHYSIGLAVLFKIIMIFIGLHWGVVFGAAGVGTVMFITQNIPSAKQTFRNMFMHKKADDVKLRF